MSLASKHATATAVQHAEERRRYSRHRDRALAWVRNARLKSGGEVSLVDLSAGGVLIDANVPLRPGSILSLEIIGGGIRTVVETHVLRCHVAALMADSARYRGACEFAQPLEFPEIRALTDLSTASPEGPLGIDAALKRLVEQAYAAESARGLPPGDVALALQALARRASSGQTDPFGRQIGNMLQELLSALRQGHALPQVLTAIERQLNQTLPDVRVRLSDDGTPPRTGAKSVVISDPGGIASSAGSVTIDFPANTVVNDSQARLLRTSSRLIALLQRVNGQGTRGVIGRVEAVAERREAPSKPPITIPNAVSAEPVRAAAGWQKVVVRYADGQLLKGFTQDFHASRSQFSLWPSINSPANERVVVPVARLKAVFFVREFGGDPDYVEQKTFDHPAHGRRIEVTLLDDEVLVGTTLNYRTDSAGFFLNPADPRVNNVRVFVVSGAVRQVRFP